MSFARAAVFVAVVGTMLTGFAASPAAADTTPYVNLGLTISTTNPDGSPGETRHGSLTCNPTGGAHDNPSGACAELIAVSGDFEAADHDDPDTACPLYVAPVTVHATGTYDGSPVDYTHSYSNPCFFDTRASQVWNF